MPLAREVAVTPDGKNLALRIPGFGWIVRGSAERFMYLCDALAGVDPLATRVPWTQRGDGSLLVAGQDGLQAFTADGCPLEAPVVPLLNASIAALAVHPDAPEVVYAIAHDSESVLFASLDGGATFERRSPLLLDATPSALVLGQDPDHLYASQNDPEGGTRLSFSSDGGHSFESTRHGNALALLHAGRRAGVWAMAEDEATPGVVLLRADSSEGSFEERLRVRFFGGFAVDETREGVTLWVGDEAGGVLRSNDHGAVFVEVQPDTAVACLSWRANALWACTPGLVDQPALTAFEGSADGEPTPIVALADVESPSS